MALLPKPFTKTQIQKDRVYGPAYRRQMALKGCPICHGSGLANDNGLALHVCICVFKNEYYNDTHNQELDKAYTMR